MPKELIDYEKRNKVNFFSDLSGISDLSVSDLIRSYQNDSGAGIHIQ